PFPEWVQGAPCCLAEPGRSVPATESLGQDEEMREKG
ncbi:MAG: hypothetical protein K0R68_2327, partial [Mycobacterium sp.]|nr:hypothetical protein [Mycobacterium sp.]